MSDDFTALRALAEKATPGPWHFHQDDGTALDISEVCIPRPEEDVDLTIASLLEDRDGAFIAAANPSVVLALLDRLERAEAERDALGEAFDRDLPWRYDELSERLKRAEAAIERAKSKHRKMTDDDEPYCLTCYQPPYGHAPWHCPTLAALDTGEDAD